MVFNKIKRSTMLALFIVVVFFMTTGCEPEIESIPDSIQEELSQLDQLLEEKLPLEEMPADEPVRITEYYWPELNEGLIELSTGEVLYGPDLFISDPGFIGEFTRGKTYRGKVAWRLEDIDLSALEWLNLVFNVAYYKLGEVEAKQEFNYTIDGFEPGIFDSPGFQEHDLGITGHLQDFSFTIDNMIVARDVKVDYIKGYVSYIAFELEIVVSE